MDLRSADWERLRELRSGFLHAASERRLDDYWKSERDLELYDASFGERIRWKWLAVLHELRAREFPARPAVVLDWGCGSGVAARAWLDEFGSDGLDRLHLWDRSPAAQSFARRRLQPLAPHAQISGERPASSDLLLVSHVLDEVDARGFEELLEACRSARTIVWLEPGTRESARALVELRERLRGELHVLAPCPHSGACALAAPERAADWCHHFARAPRSVFQDAFWGRFARELGIDLRALPYSFLALAREPAAPPPADLARVLGRPRMEKGRARLDVCTSAGVATRDFLARHDPARFDELGEEPERARLYRLQEQEGRLRALVPWP